MRKFAQSGHPGLRRPEKKKNLLNGQRQLGNGSSFETSIDCRRNVVDATSLTQRRRRRYPRRFCVTVYIIRNPCFGCSGAIEGGRVGNLLLCLTHFFRSCFSLQGLKPFFSTRLSVSSSERVFAVEILIC
jgi:hypothetical protein